VIGLDEVNKRLNEAERKDYTYLSKKMNPTGNAKKATTSSSNLSKKNKQKKR
jgi:hypothetical protein